MLSLPVKTLIFLLLLCASVFAQPSEYPPPDCGSGADLMCSGPASTLCPGYCCGAWICCPHIDTSYALTPEQAKTRQNREATILAKLPAALAAKVKQASARAAVLRAQGLKLPAIAVQLRKEGIDVDGIDKALREALDGVKL